MEDAAATAADAAAAQNMMIHITKAEKNKKDYLPLLLLADPDENMIDKYLDAGDLYLMKEQDETICVAVVVRLSDTECELKNLAVAEPHQHQGNATAMMLYLFYMYQLLYETMYVGTSEKGVSFYQKLGFEYDRTLPGFFTQHYPEPVYEDGVLCEDMIYLKKDLTAAGHCCGGEGTGIFRQ
ncbi:GNAT family N-acetyltransferase [Diplocloster hominis]|uniref:GNAT family N-acetyltransferase n=1 Tax=Diplocloster hominis TaxID=3079010 RepID=UPI0031BB0B05